MYTSAIKSGKTAAIYCCTAALCVAITNIYALFGHGIRSRHMDFMFLYPLIGGALIFALLKLAGAKKPVSRAGYNIYNSGIATLTAAAMLEGIIEIAGSGSRWITVIRYAGATLTAAGIGSYFWGTLKRIGALKRK